MRFAKALVFLWVGTATLSPPTAMFSGELTREKRMLEIPVVVAGDQGGALRCAVSRGPTVPVCAVAFSPDGTYLAAGGYGEILLWNLAEGMLQARLGAGKLHRSIGALEYVKDGRLAIGHGAPGGPGAVSVIDIETGEPTMTLDGPKDVVYSLAVSPDGKLLVAGGADALARVWSLEEGKLLTTLEGHAGWVLGVSFSPDGKLLVTSSADRSAWVWDVTTWETTVRFLEGEAVQGALVAADGKSVVLAVGGRTQRSLQLRRLDNPRSNRPLSTQGGIPRGIVGTSKTLRMYVPCSDGLIRVYEANGKLSPSLVGHDDWVQCVALAPDETKLASGCSDGTVKIWNLATGRAVATLAQLSPCEETWLIVTSKGYFETSSPEDVRWLAASGEVLDGKSPEGLQDADRVRAALTKMESPTTPDGRASRKGNTPRAKDRPGKSQKARKAQNS